MGNYFLYHITFPNILKENKIMKFFHLWALDLIITMCQFALHFEYQLSRNCFGQIDFYHKCHCMHPLLLYLEFQFFLTIFLQIILQRMKT